MTSIFKPNNQATVGRNAFFAASAALFSDGYQNGVVGLANLVLRKLHPVEMAAGKRGVFFSSFGFLGITFGMLVFGYAIDRVGRKNGMFIATSIVAIFAGMLALAWGSDVTGMLTAMIVYRCCAGFGIGAEYPASSCAAAESSEDPNSVVPKTRKQLYFALCTNGAIDWGFVIAAIVPLVLYSIFGNDHLDAVWRLSFGFGVLPPLLVLYFRSKVGESNQFKTQSMAQSASVPWSLIIKRYWKPFLGLSISWYIYDFIAYPFGIYSDTIFAAILGDTTDLTPILGWNIVSNLFYIPGAMIGAYYLDRVQPKTMMIAMLVAQAVFGFLMSGLYNQLSGIVPLFALIYGIFLSLGEAGPGNCLGLLAAKSFPTAIRGRCYAACAIIGKLGALTGTWCFGYLVDAFPNSAAGPFWVASGLALFSAALIYLTLTEVTETYMIDEDLAFRAYLEANGYDVSQMGLHLVSGAEEIAGASDEKSMEEDEKVVLE